MPKHAPRPRPKRTRPPLSRRKRVAFTLVALAIPVALLALTEFALRLFTGDGGYAPTFQKLVTLPDGADFIATNPESSQAYFYRNREQTGTLAIEGFARPKPADTFRVFLVGGSAIKGYPQPRAFAPSAFLEALLSDAWPDRNVEVINLGTTAVASFPALRMMTDALDHEPDLVVVYSGHNEFFGAYGVSSLSPVLRSPPMIALQFAARRLAIVQLIDRGVASLGRSAKPPESGRMLMEVMMSRPYTGPDDPLRAAAARNLEAHLRAMVRRCHDAGVPILVCTLPVNERGLAPLGSFPIEGLDPGDQAELRAALDEAPGLIGSDPEGAIERLRPIIDTFPGHARAHWLFATALHALGRFDEALDHFQQAVDLDPIPWRATSIQIDAIRAASSEPGATLCDVQGAFRDASEGGTVGWALMDDHVHMSLRGQELVARTIVRTMASLAGEAGVDPPRLASLPGWEEYAARLGDNVFERYAVAYRMRRLMDVPFFRDSNAASILLMDQRLRDLESQMSENELQVVRAWQDPRVNLGYQRPLSALVGSLAMREGRFAEASHRFHTAMNCVQRFSTPNIEYAYLSCRAQQLGSGGVLDEEATRVARDALGRALIMIEHSPTPEPALHRHAGTLYKVLGEHEASIPHLFAARVGYADEGLVELDGVLVNSLIEARQFDRALALTDWGVANAGPDFSPVYRALRQVVVSANGAPPGTGNP